MGMFAKILVAMDESAAGSEAETYAAELANVFGGSITRCRIAGTDPGRRSAREAQIVNHVVEAAKAVGADVIVLGLDRRHLEHHRLAPSLRERLHEAAPVPVLVPPRPVATAEAPARHLTARQRMAAKGSLQHV